jgi:hypothetical protein
MICRGPGFLADSWFGSSPTLLSPDSRLDRLHKGRLRGGWGRSLILYKSFNTLCLKYRTQCLSILPSLRLWNLLSYLPCLAQREEKKTRSLSRNINLLRFECSHGRTFKELCSQKGCGQQLYSLIQEHSYSLNFQFLSFTINQASPNSFPSISLLFLISLVLETPSSPKWDKFGLIKRS